MTDRLSPKVVDHVVKEHNNANVKVLVDEYDAICREALRKGDSFLQTVDFGEFLKAAGERFDAETVCLFETTILARAYTAKDDLLNSGMFFK